MLNLKQFIRLWSVGEGNYKVKAVCQAIPIIILCFLWKSKNTIIHGGSYSKFRVWDINDTINKFIYTRFRVNYGSSSWPLSLSELEQQLRNIFF
ncbi:hypothetical protein RDI58_020110 [Solanum bulbocastanum]|uniref:Uncharacterized protein n=1 Tax=Solanum bulbocastanum TaxID=147425 RepID=A0AAN8T9E1_SOLBU